MQRPWKKGLLQPPSPLPSAPDHPASEPCRIGSAKLLHQQLISYSAFARCQDTPRTKCAAQELTAVIHGCSEPFPPVLDHSTIASNPVHSRKTLDLSSAIDSTNVRIHLCPKKAGETASSCNKSSKPTRRTNKVRAGQHMGPYERPDRIGAAMSLESRPSRRPDLSSCHDIPGARPSTGFRSDRSTNPLNPVYDLPKSEAFKPKQLKFIRDSMDVSDIEGARSAKGQMFRCVSGEGGIGRGGTMVDWGRARSSAKTEGVSRPPTGSSSAADIEGATPTPHGIFRCGNVCDFSRARNADACVRNEGGGPGSPERSASLGKSNIGDAIGKHVQGKPAPPPLAQATNSQRPSSNKGGESYDVFGRPATSGSAQETKRANFSLAAAQRGRDPPPVQPQHQQQIQAPNATRLHQSSASASEADRAKVDGDFIKWTCDDVCTWLERVGFGDSVSEYQEAFRRMGIDGSMLPDLDDGLLQAELQIKFALHRRKILSHVRALHSNQNYR